MGVQHVIAMFGATVLAPILMGFDPNVAMLMSGVGTLIFFFITGGKVPSYLGSSFAFIGVVIAATAMRARGPTPTSAWRWAASSPAALLYTLIGAVVQAVGTGWIERFMPPVVTGAVVAVIGLNLAGHPHQEHGGQQLRQLDAGGDLRQRGPGGGAHARHGAAPADPGGPDRGQRHLRRADQRPGPGQANGPVGHCQRGLVRHAGFASPVFSGPPCC
jgi:xanthine/uracil permease